MLIKLYHLLSVSTVQVPAFSHNTSWLDDSKQSYNSAKTNKNSFFSKVDNYLFKNLNTEKEPFKPWPGSVNPHTGEVGGPRGEVSQLFGIHQL